MATQSQSDRRRGAVALASMNKTALGLVGEAEELVTCEVS